MEYGRLTAYDIVIESTQNKRAIVRVGCGTFAFDNVAEIVGFVEQYITDPQSIRDQCNQDDRPVEYTRLNGADSVTGRA